ncbi:MAG: sulfurtransferase, partial [Burkholderiales bacterium]
MPWTTLIAVDELAEHIDRCLVVDSRHDLTDPAAGRRQWTEAHVPGAVFVSLDEQLSVAKNGRNGRHPMPSREQVRDVLASIGLSDDTQLVVYDGGNGMAGRLWWMAKWIGHDAVAVLDGGMAAWRKAGYPVAADAPAPRTPGRLALRAPLATLADADETGRAARDASRLVVDARPAERYRGEIEPMDPVAGHIPGALSRPWSLNVREDGRFKPAPVLRAEFDALLAGREPSAVVNSCGSGVSACINLLAMAHAGLPGAALYGGSWSEWVSDPSRPVAPPPHPRPPRRARP